MGTGLDLFQRAAYQIRTPLTADQCLINWGGIITNATNMSLAYAQGVTKKHTIGSQGAIIYTSQPDGQIALSQLMTTDFGTLFSLPGWSVCNPATITLTLAGGCSGAPSGIVTLTAIGCVVQNFTSAVESEGLTVVSNLSISFLQCFSS